MRGSRQTPCPSPSSGPVGGKCHAVLIVGTDQGDYVLDNLSPWIKGWQEVNYTWIERQVPGKPLRWANVTIKPMIVAAAY